MRGSPALFTPRSADRVLLSALELPFVPPEQPPPPRVQPVHYPWLQTRMALERTLLAWVRTAASLIAFGFAIFHFFDMLNSMQGVRPPWRPYAARLLGVSMVAAGTTALVLALIQYRAILRLLRDDALLEESGLAAVPRFRLSLVAALALTAVGLITLVTLLVRLPI